MLTAVTCVRATQAKNNASGLRGGFQTQDPAFEGPSSAPQDPRSSLSAPPKARSKIPVRQQIQDPRSKIRVGSWALYSIRCRPDTSASAPWSALPVARSGSRVMANAVLSVKTFVVKYSILLIGVSNVKRKYPVDEINSEGLGSAFGMWGLRIGFMPEHSAGALVPGASSVLLGVAAPARSCTPPQARSVPSRVHTHVKRESPSTATRRRHTHRERLRPLKSSSPLGKHAYLLLLPAECVIVEG